MCASKLTRMAPIKVKATADDAHLGSENSDTKIVNLCAVVMVPA